MNIKLINIYKAVRVVPGSKHMLHGYLLLSLLLSLFLKGLVGCIGNGGEFMSQNISLVLIKGSLAVSVTHCFFELEEKREEI